MTRTALFLAGLAVALASSSAAPAFAPNTTSFLSGTGSGTACTRTAPCNNTAAAVAATSANGTIVCLDSGEFDFAMIDKTLVIDCTGTASSMGLLISGSGIVVTVRGVRFDGGATLVFQNGAALAVENCLFTNVPNGFSGLLFEPGSAGAQLAVTDSLFTNNGGFGAGGGIVIKPTPGGTAQAVLSRVTVAKNVFGIAADGTGSTGGINMTIADSVITGNSQDGIVATTPAGRAPIGVLVTNTKSANNAFGIRSIGPNVTVRVENWHINRQRHRPRLHQRRRAAHVRQQRSAGQRHQRRVLRAGGAAVAPKAERFRRARSIAAARGAR